MIPPLPIKFASVFTRIACIASHMSGDLTAALLVLGELARKGKISNQEKGDLKMKALYGDQVLSRSCSALMSADLRGDHLGQ